MIKVQIRLYLFVKNLKKFKFVSHTTIKYENIQIWWSIYKRCRRS